MSPIRVRHPNGVNTIQLALENDSVTVQDLLRQVHLVSDILPSRQIIKSGYPPKTLTLIPELPISSLGVQPGDQLIVSERTDETSPSLASATAHTPVLAASSPPSIPSSSGGPDHVEVDGSFLVHRIVPDDNSCLFSAVALIFKQDISKAQSMRQIVADGIRQNSDTYNEAILGMPPSQYINTILKPTSWGGAIELSILASHFGAEIDSIDVETGRIDRFAPPENTSNGMRCIVIYSGIHYDAATLAPMPDAPSEWHQTLFPIQPSSDDSTDPMLIAGKQLAEILRSKKAYTNTATFDLRCEQCGKGLKGEKEARAHAEETDHVRFGEY